MNRNFSTEHTIFTAPNKNLLRFKFEVIGKIIGHVMAFKYVHGVNETMSWQVVQFKWLFLQDNTFL